MWVCGPEKKRTSFDAASVQQARTHYNQPYWLFEQATLFYSLFLQLNARRHTSIPPCDVNLLRGYVSRATYPPLFLPSPYQSHHAEGRPHNPAASHLWRSLKRGLLSSLSMTRDAFLFNYAFPSIFLIQTLKMRSHMYEKKQIFD